MPMQLAAQISGALEQEGRLQATSTQPQPRQPQQHDREQEQHAEELTDPVEDGTGPTQDFGLAQHQPGDSTAQPRGSMCDQQPRRQAAAPPVMPL